MIGTVLAGLILITVWGLWRWLPTESSRFTRNVMALYVPWRLIEALWLGWPVGEIIGTMIGTALLYRAYRIARAREARQARDRHEAIR